MSRRGRTIGAGAAVVAASAAVLALAVGAGDGTATAQDEPVGLAAGTTTATVRHGALNLRETANGTLGYADETPVAAGAAGTVTAVPEEGTVLEEGHSLLEVDGARTLWLLGGAKPAWRDLGPSVTDGEDVRQLERALRRVGADPDHDMTVDDAWTAATTAAVQRFQEARGLAEDGTLSAGELVFRPDGADGVRIGEVDAATGDRVQPGKPVATLSSRAREVQVDLDADRQTVAQDGEAVTVVLPDASTVRGRISAVGRVASAPAEEGGDATIPVTITLRGKGARGLGLDRAPVQVRFVTERAEDVDVAPVTALLAQPGGGYAVQLVTAGGRLRTVPVELGLQASGEVAVTGDGVREGARVVVPA